MISERFRPRAEHVCGRRHFDPLAPELVCPACDEMRAAGEAQTVAMTASLPLARRVQIASALHGAAIQELAAAVMSENLRVIESARDKAIATYEASTDLMIEQVRQANGI